MAIVSLLPGSPLSTISSLSVALPSTETGASWFVMSWITPLETNWALPVVGSADMDVMDVLFTWYVCPPERQMTLACPCGLVPPLLYLTLKPKLLREPTSPFLSPADFDRMMYPPPVMKLLSGLETVTIPSSELLLRL